MIGDRETDRERQRDRQRDRQRERETDRDRDRQSDTETETEVRVLALGQARRSHQYQGETDKTVSIDFQIKSDLLPVHDARLYLTLYSVTSRMISALRRAVM